ncbi:thioredoxin-like protein [Pisolithus croceorrhizus]|nr:thioredoxin-like protein [Pisolithus croceorrhizus]KAI6124018.1 thioredoxin-like protein [Pisolithus croceorrhizus]KAI6164181.1 thioredoxin-like protein [Pisolithus thermaeus]
MAVNPNEDTEFNDALRKFGIIPPREATPKTPSPPPSPPLGEVLDDLTLNELHELGDEVTDDDRRRAIESVERQRIAKEREEQKRARFGRVYPIGRDDYTREVTEASRVDEEGDDKGRGTGVVCFLYKDGIPRSDRTFEHLRTLAARYPRTKFVSIVGNKCIPDLPDSRIPMLIIYRKGEIMNQLIAWGADREKRLEELEVVLLLYGAIEPSMHEGHSRHQDGGSDDEDDPSARSRSATTSTNARPARNIRQSATKGNDSDSDFEFDM